MRGVVYGISCSLFLVIFSCCRFSLAAAAENGSLVGEMEMVPVAEPPGKAGMMAMMMMMNEGRRKLGRFQVCSLCTCCGGGGGGRSYCLASPCCYAINCNIPNRPFGYCSFTPKTCNCFGCHI